MADNLTRYNAAIQPRKGLTSAPAMAYGANVSQRPLDRRGVKVDEDKLGGTFQQRLDIPKAK